MTTLFIPALFSCHAQAGKRGLAPASRAPRPRLVPAAPAGTACLLRPSASATPRPRRSGRPPPRRLPAAVRKVRERPARCFGLVFIIIFRTKRKPGPCGVRRAPTPAADPHFPARPRRARPGRRGAGGCRLSPAHAEVGGALGGLGEQSCARAPPAPVPAAAVRRSGRDPGSRGAPRYGKGRGWKRGVRATSGRGGRAEGPGGAPVRRRSPPGGRAELSRRSVSGVPPEPGRGGRSLRGGRARAGPAASGAGVLGRRAPAPPPADARDPEAARPGLRSRDTSLRLDFRPRGFSPELADLSVTL
ncbi:hypothetical protein J1605_010775 [Eschrichtius robustus]|uniref:Uncharacterized protein n=1 Tax=Eschrichtius robustus TaxID=9764 RepID=A0AB34GSM5_ESCRO|nr:hypothetical protein J1605_010775 [Eschrichtius robustus]